MKITQRTLNRKSVKSAPSRRGGVAATECALVLPLLVGLVMGAVDVGQFVNVGQVVNNASREGARRASRDGVTTTAEATTSVRNAFAAAFPNVPEADLNAAINVTVFDSEGSAINNGSIEVSSGNPITVRVRFNYDAVRWARGFPTLSNQVLQKTTTMRRE